MKNSNVIPFGKLESIPDYISPDGNYQFCYYNTSRDNSTLSIGEHTKFPSFQDLVRYAYKMIEEEPKTKVTYSVFYGNTLNENNVLDLLPIGASRFFTEPEPYYNEQTKQCDIFRQYIEFEEDHFKDAYNYAISHNPIVL